MIFFTSTVSHVPGIPVYVYVPNALSFAYRPPFLFRPREFSCVSRMRDAQWARLYTARRSGPRSVPVSARSGRSKSRELACNYGIAFSPARASQDNGKPTFQLCYSNEPHGNNTRFKLSPFLQPRTLRMRVCCVCYVSAGLCICALKPHTSARFFSVFVFLLCLLLLYHVCITPSLKLSSSLLCGSHGTTAVSRTWSSPVCDGHGRSICLCACACHKHRISREVQKHAA